VSVGDGGTVKVADAVGEGVTGVDVNVGKKVAVGEGGMVLVKVGVRNSVGVAVTVPVCVSVAVGMRGVSVGVDDGGNVWVIVAVAGMVSVGVGVIVGVGKEAWYSCHCTSKNPIQ
jgi:hypothetical protein